MIDSGRVNIATIADESGSGVISTTGNGRLLTVRVDIGTSTTPNITITDSLGQTLYTESGLSGSVTRHPRAQAHNSATGAALVLTSGNEPLVVEQGFVGPLTVTVASGGVSKSLSVACVWEK